ncbi:MAG: XdhC family protein [Solirubrobacteraceae bacterium]|nr:XdhC family protein [Solirubrobacteraceae bacterium]
MRDLIPVLDAWTADGRRAALCTVVAVHGRAPLPLGASLIVAEDGATAGAISGGCVERDVTEVAQQVLRGAVPRRLRFAPGHDGLTGTGLPCGGGIDVWVQQWGAGPLADRQEAFAELVRAGEGANFTFDVGALATAFDDDPTAGVATAGGRFTLTAPPLGRLILVGAGPTAGALAELAPTIGMRPVIVDPRPAVAAHAPTDAASELLLAWPENALATLGPLREADAVIALSHQPAIDDAALLAAIAGGAAGFVGALGSRTAHEARLERLRGRGADEAALARIVGPVGLDLGGWAPSEVALSIAAELVAVRHGRAGGRLAEAGGAIHESQETGGMALVEAQAPPESLLPGVPAGSSPITGVVLAAGAGRRFGGAKAAAEWEGQPLVARAVRAAAGGLPAGSDLIVVVGAHEATVRAALPADVPHRVVVAHDWEEGMGASLRAGLAEARSMAALVLLADQPLVDAELVAHVVREGCPAIRAGAAAARPVAADTPGHPVLLGPIALTRAFDLSGDQGLAPLLETLHVHRVDVNDLASVTDVDQPADLLRAPLAPAAVTRARSARAGKGRGPARPAAPQPQLDSARQRRGPSPRSGREHPWT